MTVHQAFDYPAARITSRSESLFMLAYRCWQAGYDYADAECWHYAWSVLSNELGPKVARPVLNAVEDFVRVLRHAADERIDYFPPPCCRMSSGERRVLALVAALQAKDPDAIGACHDRLCVGMQAASADVLLAQARSLATALSQANLILDPRRRPVSTAFDLGRLH